MTLSKNILKESTVFFGEPGQFPIFALPKTSRVRLRARTPPFHGGDTGSNPVRGTKVFNLGKIEKASRYRSGGFFVPPAQKRDEVKKLGDN